MFPSDLWAVTDTESRSISPENPDGAIGGGAKAEAQPELACSELGTGWKTRPCVSFGPGETLTVAEIDGPGSIKHIWMTCLIQKHPNPVPWSADAHNWRDMILRIYWDDQEAPSVECPLGDFFACGWGKYAQVSSAAVCVNPGNAFNCYWDMPFQKKCRITLENRWLYPATLFYQVDYELKRLPPQIAYFHAQFRRTNPTEYKKPHVILDGVRGQGCYVGTYMCWGSNTTGWWGEGEIKFYMDGDRETPTICGTGTEDYFCGSYNFENVETGQYQEYCTLYAGMPQVLRPDGVYQSQTRFSLYRWHITDPIYFKRELKVDIQAIGWISNWKYKALRDDLASTAFWYQTLPHAPFPPLQNRGILEIG